MATNLHDSWHKQHLATLLSPFGEVEVSREIRDEARHVDVVFSPRPPGPDPTHLGLLGLLAQGPCLFEPYSTPPRREAFLDCLLKALTVAADLRRAARRRATRAPQEQPWLWIIAPSLAAARLHEFSLTAHACGVEGVQTLAPALRAGVIVVDHLPPGTHTLWLRLMGRGEVQRRAAAELQALPQDHPLRAPVVLLVVRWRAMIGASGAKLTPVEREFLMNVDQIVQKWHDDALREGLVRGRQEGRQEGRQAGRLEAAREVLLNLVERRFGPPPPSLSDRIAGVNDDAVLQAWALQAAEADDLASLLASIANGH